MAERLTTLDLVEGMQLGHAAVALHDLGVLGDLGEGATVADLAARHGLDPALLGGALAWLEARTDLVVRDGERWVTTENYTPYARYLLDMYGLAYGRGAARLGDLLAGRASGARLVDASRHARAFGWMAGRSSHPLASIVAGLGIGALLDLGCADAGLLVEVAASNPVFLGWGLERNPAMRRRARARLAEAGLGRRVRVLAGDAFSPEAAIPEALRPRVAAVSASQLANELFGAGDEAAVRWLAALRACLPGRTLLLADYYGRLGTGPAGRETLLHDYAQLLAGQGVPPPDREAWSAIYTRAGCRLAGVLEDRATTRFVHIVAL